MKRFWKEVRVAEREDGFSVLLDGRPVRTPARHDCILPTRPMAERVATEWNAQEGQVSPLSMPMTRAAATCLDRVAPELNAVHVMIAEYGGTDLLCYRADCPEGLVARQAEGWNPLLEWAAQDLEAPLNVGAGVMHVAQPTKSLVALAGAVARHNAWEMTALSELVTISGSLVLGLAVGRGHLAADDAWALSRIDEKWNIDEWGEDEEEAGQTARRRADFLHAAQVWQLLKDR